MHKKVITAQETKKELKNCTLGDGVTRCNMKAGIKSKLNKRYFETRALFKEKTICCLDDRKKKTKQNKKTREFVAYPRPA